MLASSRLRHLGAAVKLLINWGADNVRAHHHQLMVNVASGF
jgi:hypothetical protein